MIVDLSICANRSNQTHILKMMIECKCIFLWTVYLPERTTCTVYRSQQQSENVSHGITIFGGPACVYIYIYRSILKIKRGTGWISARNLQCLYFQCLVFQGIFIRKTLCMKHHIFAHVLLPEQWPFPGDEASVRVPGTRAEVRIPANPSHSAWHCPGSGQWFCFNQIGPACAVHFSLKLWQKQKNQSRLRGQGPRPERVRPKRMMGMRERTLKRWCRSMVLRESGTNVMNWKRDSWVVGLYYTLKPHSSRRTTAFVLWTRVCLVLVFPGCACWRNVQFQPLMI